MIETIGTENVKLSDKEMDMITQLVVKEVDIKKLAKKNKQKEQADCEKPQNPLCL